MEAPQESDAQRRARERRERRQAKIASQGSSRLEAITSLSGRPAPAVEDASPAPPAKLSSAEPPPTTTAAAAHDSADPPEVDISEHYYQPAPRRLPPSSGASGASTPFGPASGRDSPFAGGGAMDSDPMMRMMQQMMQGGDQAGGGGAGGGAQGGGEDPMMKMMQAMMGMNGGGAPGGQTAEAQKQATGSAYVWRVVHAVFSFGLAAYVALTSTFDGSKLGRVKGGSFTHLDDDDAGAAGRRLFYIFATVEVLLQTTRFFVEKGRLQHGGIMGTLATVLPEPFAGYVRLAGRYSVIYTTVVADAMVVVFVLGVMAWWQGAVVN
ncbi:sad1 interacting factor 1 protein [Diplodia corticola]|uniref:Sad1 interacting factor 1 protein n=1 Tax=Diplodia corticola TaxID=236234 RepID=A0A1J9RWI7_9PEZI|nr:sad1 interacting factor 1 protein [Diplodia corticola]OJD31845.1 sad1 interacting factor 1 protein [Diplodia corticola]